MKLVPTLLCGLAFSALAGAVTLTPAQQATFKGAVSAETDSTVVACRAVRNDICLADWYNTVTATKAWRSDFGPRELFEAMNLTTFDGLTAGKRTVWQIMLSFAPVDFSRHKIRQAVADVWNAADRDAILNAGSKNASRFELVFGGTSATTGTVTATVLNVHGPVTVNDVSDALNLP